MSSTIIRRLLATSRLSRLAHDRRAVSAVEFALLLPLMLTIYLGGGQVGEAISIYRKVGHTAYTLGDLVTQSSTLTASDMSNILDASTAVMSPYSASTAKMVISALNFDGTKYTVAWSQQRNSTAWTVGSTPPSTVTIPTTIVSSGQQLIVSYVTYTYVSPFGSFLKDFGGNDAITLSDIVYLRPRLSTTITCCS